VTTPVQIRRSDAPEAEQRKPTQGVIQMRNVSKFLQDESGASAAEYALILALVAVAIIAALGILGTNIGKVLNTVAGDI
jgi:pilus assembly protein Flp/PilA